VDSYTSAELGYTVYSTIHVGSRWKIQTRREIKNTRQHMKVITAYKKANNAKHSKTKQTTLAHTTYDNPCLEMW